MSICYDQQPYTGPVNLTNADATKNYLIHYGNELLLTFLANHSDDRIERAQAAKEIEIAQRKQKFWRAHHNYDHAVALRAIDKLKKEWAGRVECEPS